MKSIIDEVEILFLTVVITAIVLALQVLLDLEHDHSTDSADRQ